MRSWVEPSYRGVTGNVTLTDSICDAGCGDSLQSWFKNVDSGCKGYNISTALPTLLGGRLWAGYNETCLKSIDGTNRYCNDLLDSLPTVESIDRMSKSDLCRFCNVERIAMMQRSPYSVYDEFWKSQLEYIYLQCGTSGPTAIPPSVIEDIAAPEAFCLSDVIYTTTKTETCDSIALQRSLSSAALYMANQPAITNCSSIRAGTKLCLPLSCQKIYTLKPDDNCISIEKLNYSPSNGLGFGEIVQTYNPWVSFGCKNLQGNTSAYGRVICLSPQNGQFNITDIDRNAIPKAADGHSWVRTSPPAGAKVATGTTSDCGKWYKAAVGDTCTSICLAQKITSSLFLGANPALGTSMDGCDAALKSDLTYCTGPTYSWKEA